MAHTRSHRPLRNLFGLLLGVGVAAVACNSPKFELGSDVRVSSTGTTGNGGTSAVTGSAGEGGGAGASVEHCDNGVTDANETGADCGGRDCRPCRVGEPCRIGTDCTNGECTAGICRDASCMDELKNGSESDIDCGGGECPACGPGKECREQADCTSESCGDDNVCQASNCDDRVKNGNETDVDCGGSCVGCEVGDACLLTSDCAAPPDARSESISCDVDTEKCLLLCGRGTADCNQSASDGCEVTLSTDIDHCGACGEACDLDNADAQCQGGSCRIVSCAEGFSNCNNDANDGCEIDIASDPSHCGACGDACSSRNGEPTCAAGECSIECDSGFENCNDDLADGCEANLNRSVDHCQECELVCEGSAATLTPFCDGAGDGCGETECEADTGDCDGDGECTDDLTGVEDCGRCGNSCQVAHGTPACVAATCSIEACDTDYADCDGVVNNGCERNLDNDRRFCGDCATNCTTILTAALHVSDVGCAAGSCIVTSCEVGWADCDAEFDNGCEVDITSDNEQCGGCADEGGVDCSSEYPNGIGVCEQAACLFESCADTFGDCNQNAGAGSAGDGCETTIAFNDEHCGGCEVACEAPAGTLENACGGANGDTCLPECVSDYGDCDNNPNNGCEALLLLDAAHCGACGNECESVNGDNQCSEGTCDPDCDSGYLSCDDNPNNGCEQSITVVDHCGACDDNCSVAGGAQASCSAASECSVECSGNNRSCNDEDSARDGCESNIATNPNHCGACGARCADTNVATRGCQAGSCNPVCDALWCPAPDPADGCTLPLGTPQNCAICGQSCSAPTPFCESEGGFHCDYLDVAVVNTGTGASAGWDNGVNALSVVHDLSGAPADYRMVVLGISSGAGAPIMVSYGGTPVDEPVVVNDDQTDTWVGIYVVLEAQLPSAANPQAAVQFDGWGWGQIDVVLLAGVDQNEPIHSVNDSSDSNGCGSGTLRSSGVTFSGRPGSFVYALLSGRQASAASLQTGVFTSTFNETSGFAGGEHGWLAAALSGPQSAGTIASWQLSGCYRSASVAIGIQRAESL